MPGDPHYVQHYRDHSEARRAPEREPHREGAKKVETEVFGRKTTTYVDDGKEGVGGATYDAVIANQASTGRSSFRFSPCCATDVACLCLTVRAAAWLAQGAGNFGSTQYHREYIVYDRSQAYPEYVVFFEPG